MLHGTWRTPGPHCTPLRVTPAEPAAAGAVIPLGTASARCPPVAAAPAGPLVPPAPDAPTTVLPVVPAADVPSPPCWPAPVATFVAFSGVTLGTRMTTSRRTSRPINNGE